MRRLACAAVLAAGFGLAVGCGGANSGAAREYGKEALEDLGRMLKALPADGRKPPAKLAELEPVEPMIPVAGPTIRSGETVYFWGAGYAEGSEKVVAHEKKVPEEGGYVLLQNGTVKAMTADEFRAAPKAK